MAKNENPYSKIPTLKLEKINYAMCKIISDREKAGLIEGKQITARNKFEAMIKLQTLLKDLFSEAKPQEGDSLLGLHYAAAIWKALPLEKLKAQQCDIGRELKKRREIRRQRLDAGNIDRVLNERDGNGEYSTKNAN